MAGPRNYYEQSAGPYRNTIDTPAGVDPAILQLAGDQLQVFSDGEGTSSWETFQGLNTGNLPKSTLSYAKIAQLSNQAIHNVPYQPVNRMSPCTNANTVTMPAPTWRHQNMITQVTPVRLSMHWQPQVIPPPATRHAAKHKYRATYIPPTQADAPPWPLAPGGRAPSRAQRLVPMSRSGSKAESSTTSGRRSKQHTMSTVSEYMCCNCGASFESLTSKTSPSASKEMNYVDTVPSHHERSVHAERNYLCQLCGKGFVYPKDLERHGRDAHSPIRPYLCLNTACWYSTEGFKRSDNLKRHVEGQACPTPWPFDVYLASGR
ncbi:hypothetical protein LTR35_000306 [Friedmanniomyces endolithicus]|uniref:C2H2-type domain-containing protein n=1 Tax=Friedmanniomyces endolithicus TaxID=329885 RepID=A0AAN6JBX3_9PEZI|nr:hypothetical protein LTS00_011144 [Friedmanniomyces endolithicus]KAK0293700.1 hypothetical protein LTR35_000306 [Friedmanniomyces endolithicus]KAK0324214.1 hypothetical protein LTR82_004652 [Friedmanniomyces endolithicus]KAK0993006.1 hypothetical protein LTR54_011328 [Friedmanniomyces endolithicus]